MKIWNSNMLNAPTRRRLRHRNQRLQIAKRSIRINRAKRVEAKRVKKRKKKMRY